MAIELRTIMDAQKRSSFAAWVPTYIYIIQISPNVSTSIPLNMKIFFQIYYCLHASDEVSDLFILFSRQHIWAASFVFSLGVYHSYYIVHNTSISFAVGGVMPWVIPNRQDINLWSIPNTTYTSLRWSCQGTQDSIHDLSIWFCSSSSGLFSLSFVTTK